MPIQPKCKKCKRDGGYTSDVKSGLCERCIAGTIPKKRGVTQKAAASKPDENEDEVECECEDERKCIDECNCECGDECLCNCQRNDNDK